MSVAQIAGVDGPAVVEVWSASCAECRAMGPHLEEVAWSFSDRVELVVLDAAEHVPDLRREGIIATPTLIGIRDGGELFRLRGRRSRVELEELFEAVAEATDVSTVSRSDVWVRTGAGALLVVSGLVAGPAWPLIAIGVLVMGYGLAPLTKGTR